MDSNEELINDMKQFLNIMKEASALRYEKLKCYGSASYKIFGVPGILMRVIDKTNRMINYYEAKMHNKEITQSFNKSHESIRDNLIDAINYLTMGVMILDNEFKQLQKNLKPEILPSFEILSNEIFKDISEQKE